MKKFVSNYVLQYQIIYTLNEKRRQVQPSLSLSSSFGRRAFPSLTHTQQQHHLSLEHYHSTVILCFILVIS